MRGRRPLVVGKLRCEEPRKQANRNHSNDDEREHGLVFLAEVVLKGLPNRRYMRMLLPRHSFQEHFATCHVAVEVLNSVDDFKTAFGFDLRRNDP